MLNPSQYKFIIGAFAIIDVSLTIYGLKLLKEIETLRLQHVGVVRYLATMLDEHGIELDEFDIFALQNLGLEFKEN